MHTYMHEQSETHSLTHLQDSIRTFVGTPMKLVKCVGKTRVFVQTKMHEYSSCKSKCIRAVRTNQNARVQFMQIKMYESNSCKPKYTSEVRAAQALFMQTMMPTAAD